MNIIDQIGLFNNVMDVLDCQAMEYFPSEDSILPLEDSIIPAEDIYKEECAKDDDCDDNVEIVEVGLDDSDENEEEIPNTVHNDSEDTLDAFETDLNPDLVVEENPIITLENYKLLLPDKCTNKDFTIENFDTTSHEVVIDGSYANTDDTIHAYEDTIVKTEEYIHTDDHKTDIVEQEYVIADNSIVDGASNEVVVQSYNFTIDNDGAQNYVFHVDGVSGDPDNIVYETNNQTVLQDFNDSNVLIVMNREESNSEPGCVDTDELTQEETLLDIDVPWTEEDRDPSQSFTEEELNEIITRKKKGKRKRRKPWERREAGVTGYKDIHIMQNILGEELSRLESLSTFKSQLRGSRSRPRANVSTNSSAPSYQCSQCGKSFTRKFSLNSHLSVHYGLSNYKCPLCDKYFIQMCHLKDHIRAHGGLTPYPCSHCGKRFTRLSDVKRHTQQHLGVRYACDLCSKVFTSRHGLRYHLRAHKGLKPYVCEICQKAYSLQVSLLNHVNTHHNAAGTDSSAQYSLAKRNSASSPSGEQDSIEYEEGIDPVEFAEVEVMVKEEIVGEEEELVDVIGQEIEI